MVRPASVRDAEQEILRCRKAIQLDPTNARAHYDLGLALRAKGDLEGAVRAWCEAIRLDPKLALAPPGLGLHPVSWTVLKQEVRKYRKAIRLDPKDVEAHTNLGHALRAMRDLEGAIHSYREAIQLAPKDASGHDNLGRALDAKGDLEEAVRSFLDAIRLDPKLRTAHAHLGYALRARGDREGAIRSFRVAIRLNPRNDLAHTLGKTLIADGDFTNARLFFKLLPLDHHHSRDVGLWLALCQRLLDLEQALDAVVAGERTPGDAQERIALADIAQRPAKQLYSNAVRLYGEAFRSEPGLSGIHRYNAARAAVLAGTGRGKDGDMLDDTDRAHLRYTALSWLQEDVNERARKVKGRFRGSNADWGSRLRTVADLAAVRDPDLLGKLPESEQAAWSNLWAQVEALRAPSLRK
jgi:Flp pilus assembly protein TadD